MLNLHISSRYQSVPDKKLNTNKPVAGNLVPRASFEAADDNFFIDRVVTGRADSEWYDFRHGRIADAKFGEFALHLPKSPFERGEVRSALIPVASGRRYTLSAWVKVAEGGTCGFRMSASSGKWRFGNGFLVKTDGQWHRCSVTSEPVPESVSVSTFVPRLYRISHFMRFTSVTSCLTLSGE